MGNASAKRKVRELLPRFRTGLVLSRGRALLSHPIFWSLTIAGNSLIGGGAIALYLLEASINPGLHSFLDAVWWAVATVTTVGYGDIVPVTRAGKVVGMGLMIFGSATFWSFAALFASVLMEPELAEVEKEISDLEREMAQNRRR